MHKSQLSFFTAALVLAAPAAANASPALIKAAPLTGRIAVDGKLDEPAWRDANAFTEFVEIFPGEGSAPRERTEVSVLVGPDTLYVGVRCHDESAADIVRPLGRRDNPPGSDNVAVLLDPEGEGRSGLLFSLTAGGIQSDGLVYDDDRITFTWDAVWDGAVSLDAAGWTAEFAIPRSLLRAREAAGQRCGFGVVREIGRSHERISTFLWPRDAPGLASRLGVLGGIEAIEARADVELVPYVATRLQARPQFSDATRPRPRLLEPIADAGVDARARLGTFALTGALNPDFGQVEADQVILNLTRFEPYLPEKRPLFTQGLDVFQPVGAGREQVPQQMFYSRRIGLDAPILGAAKAVGSAGDAWRIGVVDVLATGAGQPAGASEERPARHATWSPLQPFRLAPASAYPLSSPVSKNFLAAVARWDATARTTLGAQLASAIPLATPCQPSENDLSDDQRAGECDARGGTALALEFNTSSPDGTWYAYGQGAASVVGGGPPSRTLPDGVVLRPGDSGAGAYVRAGKRGGDGLRFSFGWSYSSPRLELNAAGFQRTQNEQEARARLEWAWPRGAGPLHDLTLYVSGLSSFTTDGRGLARGASISSGFEATLKHPYLETDCELSWSDPQYDVREIEESGIPLRRPGSVSFSCNLTTDTALPVYAGAGGNLSRTVSAALIDGAWSAGAFAGVAVRPHSRLETRLDLSLDRLSYPLRFVEADGGTALVFGRLTAPSLSVTLRQTVVLARRLTFQLYGQLFTAYQAYGPFYGGHARGTAAIRPEDLQPGAQPSTDPSGHTSALVLNAVLAWEYRPGSTLFLVYARNQSELPLTPGAAVSPTLAARALGPGPRTDSLLVKWSYYIRP